MPNLCPILRNLLHTADEDMAVLQQTFTADAPAKELRIAYDKAVLSLRQLETLFSSQPSRSTLRESLAQGGGHDFVGVPHEGRVVVENFTDKTWWVEDLQGNPLCDPIPTQIEPIAWFREGVLVRNDKVFYACILGKQFSNFEDLTPAGPIDDYRVVGPFLINVETGERFSMGVDDKGKGIFTEEDPLPFPNLITPESFIIKRQKWSYGNVLTDSFVYVCLDAVQGILETVISGQLSNEEIMNLQLVDHPKIAGCIALGDQRFLLTKAGFIFVKNWDLTKSITMDTAIEKTDLLIGKDLAQHLTFAWGQDIQEMAMVTNTLLVSTPSKNRAFGLRFDEQNKSIGCFWIGLDDLGSAKQEDDTTSDLAQWIEKVFPGGCPDFVTMKKRFEVSSLKIEETKKGVLCFRRDRERRLFSLQGKSLGPTLAKDDFWGVCENGLVAIYTYEKSRQVIKAAATIEGETVYLPKSLMGRGLNLTFWSKDPDFVKAESDGVTYFLDRHGKIVFTPHLR